jgi:hypothetical protein
MLGFPPRAIAFRLVRSSVTTWAVVRLMIALLGIRARPPVGSLVFVVVVAFLTWWNVRRTRERLLYANLGIRRLTALAIVIIVTICLEILLWPILGTWASPGAPAVGDA